MQNTAIQTHVCLRFGNSDSLIEFEDYRYNLMKNSFVH